MARIVRIALVALAVSAASCSAMNDEPHAADSGADESPTASTPPVLSSYAFETYIWNETGEQVLRSSGAHDPVNGNSVVVQSLAAMFGAAADPDEDLLVEQVTTDGTTYLKGLVPLLVDLEEVDPTVWYFTETGEVLDDDPLGAVHDFDGLRDRLSELASIDDGDPTGGDNPAFTYRLEDPVDDAFIGTDLEDSVVGPFGTHYGSVRVVGDARGRVAAVEVFSGFPSEDNPPKVDIRFFDFGESVEVPTPVGAEPLPGLGSAGATGSG